MAVTKADVLAIVNSKTSGFVVEVRPANLYQDTGATNVVTAAGQSVNFVEDQSAHGLDFGTANTSTPTSAPTYETDGTLHWLNFPIPPSGDLNSEGSGLMSESTVGTLMDNNPYFAAAGLRFYADGTAANQDQQFWFTTSATTSGNVNDSVVHVGLRADDQLTVAHWFNDANFTHVISSGIDTVHAAKFKDPGSEYWVDGTSTGSNATTPSALDQVERIGIFVRTRFPGHTSPEHMAGRCYAMVCIINDTVTAQEQADIEEWLGIEAGTVDPGVDGSGALTAGAATVTGAGTVTRVATGSLAAQTATVAGVAEKTGTVTGSGSLSAQTADLSGVAIRTSTGTGALSAERATLSGTAVPTSTGTGALTAGNATLTASATLARTGTGALSAGAATLTVTVTLTRTGSATLQAAQAALAGVGQAGPSATTGTGALAAQQATLTASGEAYSTLTGTGALAAQQAAVDAAVTVTSTLTGTGTLQAANATLEATGTAYAAASGVLEAGPATLTGAGSVTLAPRTAEGELQAQSAAIVAQILRTVKGSGTMTANAASTDVYTWVELHTQDNEWVEQKVDWGKDL